jgi:hypothetical protein
MNYYFKKMKNMMLKKTCIKKNRIEKLKTKNNKGNKIFF